MKLKLGFSPCPNDTFIFDALVHQRIDTEGLEFDYFVADIEELNQKAFHAAADITKISCHAYSYITGKFAILDSGSAIGYGNGPLLIAKNSVDPAVINELRIAIPGKYTTANLLFSIGWPDAHHKKEYIFSKIEDALLKGEVDAGLIIHETRFTYQKKGLVKIADLGELWDELTGLPIPLGVIAINRKVPEEIAQRVNRIIRKSIEYAFKDASDSISFIRSNAREMDEKVINNHIRLFVNDFSIHLGTEGRKALSELYRIAGERGVIPLVPSDIFL